MSENENYELHAKMLAADIVLNLRQVLLSIFAALWGLRFKAGEEVPDQDRIDAAYKDAESRIKEIMMRATYEIDGNIKEIGNAEGTRQFYLNVFREIVKVLEDAEVTDKQDA